MHATVVLEPGQHITGAQLREHAKTLIAGYKAPRTVEFVERLPLSAAGKILKADLRRAAATSAQSAPSRGTTAATTDPETASHP